MTWLLITVIAYLLFAFANVGDKLVVSKYKTEPIVYAFYVGVMGIVTIVLLPFDFAWPNLIQSGWLMFAGVTFVFGLYFMYKAINAGETTRAITIMGSTAPIFTFLLSYLFLSERLAEKQLIAFVLLIIAVIVISWPQKSSGKFNKEQVLWAVLAGFVLATNYVLVKYIYLILPFLAGFAWVRVAGFITALIILIIPKNRRVIKIDWQRPKKQKGSLILAIQVFGGAGVIGQNYAFSIASATLVNALQAVQYAFVFIFATILGTKIPQLKESLDFKQIIQKVLAIILIAIGLYLLAIK